MYVFKNNMKTFNSQLKQKNLAVTYKKLTFIYRSKKYFILYLVGMLLHQYSVYIYILLVKNNNKYYILQKFLTLVDFNQIW